MVKKSLLFSLEVLAIQVVINAAILGVYFGTRPSILTTKVIPVPTFVGMVFVAVGGSYLSGYRCHRFMLYNGKFNPDLRALAALLFGLLSLIIAIFMFLFIMLNTIGS